MTNPNCLTHPEIAFWVSGSLPVAPAPQAVGHNYIFVITPPQNPTRPLRRRTRLSVAISPANPHDIPQRPVRFRSFGIQERRGYST
jgi:hypothetical protein